MANNDEFKRIKTEIPNSRFFALAFPPPDEKDWDRIGKQPEVFILTDGYRQVKAVRRDFRIFDWYTIPDIICWMSYGLCALDTWDLLKKTYKDMENTSKVAFFIFEKIAN